ncbi:Os10g0172600 [Oryza sativa Japonica Group]|uniref:Os10g0172600 protein n=1 Tax=Oryza sativa subsp. japonica TaxID=39947 RepID=A0A0P0XSA7_ORYSJ|nr:Os10g0172600 [Oryza sativa Japonica Group]
MGQMGWRLVGGAVEATRVYCFVHKVPVCGECIRFPEHQLCVVGTFSGQSIFFCVGCWNAGFFGTSC